MDIPEPIPPPVFPPQAFPPQASPRPAFAPATPEKSLAAEAAGENVPESAFGNSWSETMRSQRTARITLAVGLAALGAWTLQSFLPALAWAAIFAIATWPLYQRAQRRWPAGRHNLVVPLLFTLATALLFVVPLGLIAVQIGREAHGIAQWVHEARTSGVPVPGWVESMPFGAAQASDWWRANLADPQGSADLLGRLDRGQVVSMSRQFGSQVLHRAVLFGFTLLTLFFLFRDGRSLTEQMLAASRRAFGPHGERVGRQMVASVRGTVNGLVLVGLGEGALLGVAYAVAGVPHPVLLGAATAVAAMIPFGAPLVFGLAALLLLGQGATTAAIVVFAFGLVVAFVADHAIRPALIGGATRLPFVWVLLGILGGVETWGLLGLFLGPAVMAALILLWRDWTTHASARPAEAQPPAA